MKSKLRYRSFQYRKQLNSISKDPNYDLITQNGIISHFIVFTEAKAVTDSNWIRRSERVNNYILPHEVYQRSAFQPE